MRRISKSISDDIKLMNAYSEIRHYCKCGHSVILPAFVDKKICSWCGHYVFRTPKIEFEYKLKQMIRKQKIDRKENNEPIYETTSI